MARVLRYPDFGVYYASRYVCVDAAISHVTAAPVPGAVATMDVGNALSLVVFGSGGWYHLDVVKKDFLRIVSGPFEYRFTRPWSKREIAYTMTRGVVLADVQSGQVETHTIIPGLHGQIRRLEPLAPARRSFVFQCEALDPTVLLQWNRTLRAVRFDGGKAEVIGEMDGGTSFEARAWFVHQNRLFLFDATTRRLRVWTDELRPSSHELATAFDAVARDFTLVAQVVPHASLPLALVVAVVPDRFAPALRPGRLGVFVLRWGTDEGPTISPWFGGGFSPWGDYAPSLDFADGAPIELSPDLRWVIVRVRSDEHTPNERPGSSTYVGHPYRIAVPFVSAPDPDDEVDPGRPVKLLGPRGSADLPATAAWVNAPLAYVTANEYHLFRWDLAALAGARWIRPQRR